jgi:hypothetical protein
MSYKSIPGWFDWEDVYARWAAEAPPGSVFVEVGVFLGRSLSFLLEQLGDKPATVYAVDPWIDDMVPGSTAGKEEGLCTWGAELAAEGHAHGGPFESFLWNMREHCPGGLERIKVLRLPSVKASYAVERADYVWLDGDHNYGAIRADIQAWRGVARQAIGGHDYAPDFPGVRRAVDEAFGPGRHVSVGSWEVRL